MTKSAIKQMEEWLDGPEFYQLMQNYRHAPLAPQEHVVGAFESVKLAVRKKLDDINKTKS